MNSVYVAKFIANCQYIGSWSCAMDQFLFKISPAFALWKNANVTCVTFTNDARNNRNTVAFEKCDLVLSQNR